MKCYLCGEEKPGVLAEWGEFYCKDCMDGKDCLEEPDVKKKEATPRGTRERK